MNCPNRQISQIIALLITPVIGLFASPMLGANKIAKQKVTWPQIVKAVEAHPVVTKQNHLIEASSANVSAQREIPNPTIELSVARGHSAPTNETAVEWGASVSIPVDWMATRRAKTDLAKAKRQEIKLAKKQLRQDVLQELRILFWNLVYAQERVKSVQALIEQMDALTHTVDKRVMNGDARPMELTRVELEREIVAADLELAKSIQYSTSNQLATWLNTPRTLLIADATLRHRPNVHPNSPPQKKLAAHPSIRIAKAKLNSAQSATSLEQKARFPQMAFSVFAENEMDKTSMGVGLEMNIPLWNWNRGSIREAKHNEAAQKNELEAQQQLLERRFIDAQARCIASVAYARRYEQRIVPKAINVAQKMERAFELGGASLLEVIDSKRSLLETQAQYLETQRQAQFDCSELTAIIGKDTL